MAKADRLMDEQYELIQEGKAFRAFLASEATDREYAEYLDQVCPVVNQSQFPNIVVDTLLINESHISWV